MSAATMNRLLLPKKPSRIAERPFLPSGEVLPSWFNMSLIQKLPMFPYPSGAIELFQKEVGGQAYKNDKRIDFILDDPNNYLINNEYNPLLDPHLLHMWKTPRMQEKLKQLGLLTPDQKVRCSVREFNQYRAFLKRLALNEFRKQQAEQRKRVPKMMFPGDEVEVKYIETRIHEREVRTREQKMEEERLEKVKSQLCQTERRLEIRRRRKAWENEASNNASKRYLEQQHRENVYKKHMMLLRKRQRKKFRAWKRKMRRYLQRMKELEDQKDENMEEKLREGWDRRRLSEAWMLSQVEEDRQAEQDRARRYQKMFEAEMLRRWHKQAGEIQARKERSRQKHMELVQVTTKNLARAFAQSPLINPKGWRRYQQEAIEEGPRKDQLAIEGTPVSGSGTEVVPYKGTPEGDGEGEREEEGDGEKEEEEGEGTREEEAAASTDSKPEVELPELISVHMEAGKPRKWTFEESIEKMGLNVRLHGLYENRSAEELENMKAAIADAIRKVSGQALDNLPPLKRKKPAYTGTYPTRVQVLERGMRGVKPEDEIRLYISHEEMISRGGKTERWSRDSNGGEESESQFGESSTDVGPQGRRRVSLDYLPTSLDEMSPEDKNLMETLLMKLLSDTRDGSVNRGDIMKLTSICSMLWGSLGTGHERSTSCTSLAAREIVNFSLGRVKEDICSGRVTDADLVLATSTLRGSASEGSITSDKIDQLLNETLERALTNTEETDDIFNAWLVEETIKSTVEQLTADLASGNLSKAEVREIGSAVASVVLGAVRSDDSMLADEVIVPTLQQFLVDSDSVDDTLLDHTLATLLSSYTHVTRRMDKSEWDIIKEFVVESLLRSKMNLREMVFDPDEFVEALEKEKEAAGCEDMDLPRQNELIDVLATAIGRFSGCLRPTPVLCDLMKAILGPAQDDLARRKSAENLTIPRINPSMIDQAGESACCLEVALEVTASVCDGLSREMAADGQFRDTTLMRLGPIFLFIILSNWEELSAGVDTDTIAVQTSKEFKKDPVVRPSQAESLVLLCWYHLWQDSQTNSLPSNILFHVGMQVAEFPALRPVRLHAEYEEAHRIPGHVARKISKLGQLLQDGGLGYDEAKKLLAIVLHIYIREMLCSDRTPLHLSERDKATHALDDEEEVMRGDVLFLIENAARKVLEFVQAKVSQKLSEMETPLEAISITSVSEVLQRIAEEAYADLGNLNLDIEIAEEDLSQLEFIIKATSRDADPAARLDTLIIRAFFDKILGVCQAMAGRFPDPNDVCTCKTGDAKIVNDLILKELWKVSNEVTSLFSALSGRQEAGDSSPVSDRMVTFLISLMLELRRVVNEGILPVGVGFEFLQQVTSELCHRSAIDRASLSEKDVYRLIIEVMQDIEDKRANSRYFARLTNLLSQLSWDNDQHLPQGLAATAHLLSSIDPAILNQFIQTTLLSLLRGIHTVPTHSPTAEDAKASLHKVEEAPPYRSPAPTVEPQTARAVSMDKVTFIMSEQQSRETIGSQRALSSTSPGESPVRQFPETPRDSLLRKYDNTADKEILQESRVVAHEAIQRTLEKLGAAPTEELILDHDIIHTVVSRIRCSVCPGQSDDNAFQSSSSVCSPRLSTTMMAYTDDLVRQVGVRFAHDEDESLARVILTNTLDSVGEVIQSGKMPLSSTMIDVNADSFDEASLETSLNLSNAICTTLRAVRSELCLVSGVQSVSSSSTPSTDDLRNMGRAKKIVDFLVRTVESDVGEARVGFHLSQGKRLSVMTPHAPRVSHLQRMRLSSVWSVSNIHLSHNILVMFRDVLRDMHEQNKFFRPASVTPPTSRQRRGSVTMPGLPYLVDEFILSNLQDIANHIVRVATSNQHDGEDVTFSDNNRLVGRSFHAVIRRMADEAEKELHRLTEAKKKRDALRETEDIDMEELMDYDARDEELVMLNRRMMILGVLNLAFHKSYCSKSETEISLCDLSSGVSVEKCVSLKHVPRDDDMTKVIHFMQSVVPKVNAERKDQEADDVMSDDQRYVTDVVIQATLRTLDHVRDSKLSDVDLDKLCRAFALDFLPDSLRHEKQEQLTHHLETLLDDVRNGRIQRDKLQRATKELGMRTFDKTSRPVPSKSRSRDQEFLRRALSELLEGLAAQTKAEDKEDDDEHLIRVIAIEQGPPIPGRLRSCSQPSPPALPLQPYKTRPRSRSLANDVRLETKEPRPRKQSVPDAVTVTSQTSNIDDRTISKTHLVDGTANRRASVGNRFGIYSAQLPLNVLDESTATGLLKESSQSSAITHPASNTDESDSPTEADRATTDGTGAEEETGRGTPTELAAQAGGVAAAMDAAADTDASDTTEGFDVARHASNNTIETNLSDAGSTADASEAQEPKESEVYEGTEVEELEAGKQNESEPTDTEAFSGPSEAAELHDPGDNGTAKAWVSDGPQEAFEHSEPGGSFCAVESYRSDVVDAVETTGLVGTTEEPGASEQGPQEVTRASLTSWVSDQPEAAFEQWEPVSYVTLDSYDARNTEAGEGTVGGTEKEKAAAEGAEEPDASGQGPQEVTTRASLTSWTSDQPEAAFEQWKPVGSYVTLDSYDAGNIEAGRTVGGSEEGKPTTEGVEEPTEKAEQMAEDADQNVAGNATDERRQTPEGSREESAVSRTMSLTSGSKMSLEGNNDWNRSAVRSTRKSWVVYVDEVPEVESYAFLNKKPKSPSRPAWVPTTPQLPRMQPSSCSTGPSRLMSSQLMTERGKKRLKYAYNHLAFSGSGDPVFNDWRKLMRQISKASFTKSAFDMYADEKDIFDKKRKLRKRGKRKMGKKKKCKEIESTVQLPPTPPAVTPQPPSYSRTLDMAKFWVGDMAMTRREKAAMVSSSTMVDRTQDSISCGPSSLDLSGTSVPCEVELRGRRERSATFIRRQTSSLTVCTLSSTDSASTMGDGLLRRSSCGYVADNEGRPRSLTKRKLTTEPALPENEEGTAPGVCPGHHIQQKADNHSRAVSVRSFRRGSNNDPTSSAIQRAAEALSASTTSYTDVMDLKLCQQKSLEFGKTIFDRKQKEKYLEQQKQRDARMKNFILQCTQILPTPPTASKSGSEKSCNKHVEWEPCILPVDDSGAVQIPRLPCKPPPAQANTEYFRRSVTSFRSRPRELTSVAQSKTIGYLPLTVTVRQSNAPGILRVPDPPVTAPLKLPYPPPKASPLPPLSLDDSIHTVLGKQGAEAVREAPSKSVILDKDPQKCQLIKTKLPAPPSRPPHHPPAHSLVATVTSAKSRTKTPGVSPSATSARAAAARAASENAVATAAALELDTPFTASPQATAKHSTGLVRFRPHPPSAPGGLNLAEATARAARRVRKMMTRGQMNIH